MARGPTLLRQRPCCSISRSAPRSCCESLYSQHAGTPDRRLHTPVRDRVYFAWLPAFSECFVRCCVVFLGRHGEHLQGNACARPARATSSSSAAWRCSRSMGPARNQAGISDVISHCLHEQYLHRRRQVGDRIFCCARSDVDHERIGITGISMGLVLAHADRAHDHRYKAAAGFYICHEPGQQHLAQRAIPMFKDRYMWMAGFHDEDKFDAFAEDAHARRPRSARSPSLPELSPARTTIDPARSSNDRQVTRASSANTLVVYGRTCTASPTTWTCAPSSPTG